MYYALFNLEDTLEKPLEVDNGHFLSEKRASNLDYRFKLIKSVREKIRSQPMLSGALRHGSWIDVAIVFNDFFASNFNTNSLETRIPDDSQSLVFFNDLLVHLSTLSSSSNSKQHYIYETHDDFPNGLLKKSSGLFAILFRIVFNGVVLYFQFPEKWNTS